MTIDPDIKALWRAPFKHHAYGWIFDANGEVASTTSHGRQIPRGWGRIQYLVTPGGRKGKYNPEMEAVYDRWCDTFRAIVGDETDPDAVARLLTDAWDAS